MQKKWLVKCAKRQASHLAVYIAVWKQKKSHHDEQETNHQNHRFGADRGTDGLRRSHRTEFLQRGENHHEPKRVLPTRRHLRHDPDQDDRELRCVEKADVLTLFPLSLGIEGPRKF